MASRKAKGELFSNLLGSRPTQLTLLGDDGPPLGEGFFPPIYRDYAGFSRTLREAQEEGALGYDLEFVGSRPTIVGIASKRSAASLPYEQKLVEEIWDSGLPLVGHAVISADKPVTEAVLGFKTDLHRWEDTLLYFYILHQHYAKTEDRSESGESTGESGSIGLFDLFTCSAHYLLVPSWKQCRGKFCTGPCPRCLRGDSLVWLADGTKRRIADIVKNGCSVPVLSVDKEGHIVAKRITNTFRNSRNGRSFVRVSYDHALGRKINKRGVVVTDDHKFLTQRGYVEARKLENSDRVATGTLDLAPTTAKVMAGLLLGDSYSVGRFCLVHGEAQKEYLDLKCKLFLGQGRLNYVNPRHTSKAAYTWTAKQTPAIKYHCEQYQAAWQTYLTQYFTKESAVIWYLDDGCYHKYNGIISVSSYTEEEIEFLRKLLIKTLEVPDESIVVDIKDTPVRKHRIIRLRAEAFKVLAELAGPWTPPCLRYKLGASADIPQFNASLWEPGEPTVFFSPVQVYPASPRKAKNGNEADGVVFCLEVEDTNNFITEGGVVHNCAPFDYNAVDSWAPLVAWYEMKRQYEKQFPSKLAYWHKAEMAEIAEKMQARGVQYDMERAAEISNEIAAKREETAASLPFNPGSSKQILAYFETKGISLESASKEIVLHTLRSTAEEYGYSLDEIDSTSPELLQHLKSLYEWKQAGKGLKSWTDPKYLDRQNRVHPRTIVASTTTGRLSSTSPNMMNVVKRGSMARMREIVVPSRPDYCLVDSDASQLELRIVLFEAGYSEALEGDAYSMTVSAVGNLFDGPAKDTNRKPRDIAKIVVLGTNYMLGYHAYRPGDLRTGFNRQLLDQGAIHIFPNWMYCGMHMCMNGKKLAFLLFGDDTIEHRRKAIEIQLGYLERFPRVLAWQERIAKEVETTNRIVRANGYFLNLYKDPNDNLKKATAFIGQGYGADYCQGAIRAFYQKYGAVPLLTVHDELCFEVPKSWTDEECKQFMSLMSEENDMYPGFRCPIETKRGDSWGTLKPI